MTTTRNIVVNGSFFPCPVGATVDQAKIEIRSAYLLAGGFLQDHNGALVDGAALIGATTGDLTFVGGQPIQQGKTLSYFLFDFTLNVFYFIVGLTFILFFCRNSFNDTRALCRINSTRARR